MLYLPFLGLKTSHCDVFTSLRSAQSPFETWSSSVVPKGTSSYSLFLCFLVLPSSATGGGRTRLRLKHGRPASCLKALPRTPCFCASSYSLHPPPAAVVLVTFESLLARYHRNNKSGIPLKGIPDLLLALAVMIDTMHLDAPSNMIIRHLFSEQVLMYCLTSAPD